MTKINDPQAGCRSDPTHHAEYDVRESEFAVVRDRERRLATLDAALARGIADSKANRVSSAEKVFRRLEAKYSALAGRT